MHADMTQASLTLVDVQTIPPFDDIRWSFMLRLPSRKPDGCDIAIPCHAYEPAQTWQYDGWTISSLAFRDGLSRIPDAEIHILPEAVEATITPVAMTATVGMQTDMALVHTGPHRMAVAIRQPRQDHVSLNVMMLEPLASFEQEDRKRIAALIVIHLLTWAAAPKEMTERHLPVTVAGATLRSLLAMNDWYTKAVPCPPPNDHPMIRWTIEHHGILDQSATSPARLMQWIGQHLLTATSATITQQYQLPPEVRIKSAAMAP